MSDFTATLINPFASFAEGDGYIPGATEIPNITDFFFEGTVGSTVSQNYFMMRWLDVDCLPTVTYRVWVVTSLPDPTGVHYAGSKCGATAISGAVIAASWQA